MLRSGSDLIITGGSILGVAIASETVGEEGKEEKERDIGGKPVVRRSRLIKRQANERRRERRAYGCILVCVTPWCVSKSESDCG